MWREKDRARHATVDNIIERMHIACWMTKATDILSEYITLIFHGYICSTNAAQCYVMLTVPVMSILNLSLHLYPADTNIRNDRKSVKIVR
jgi:hypothetical protein